MTPETVVFTVRYTKDHCLATAWRYWQRRLGYRYALELAIGSGLLVLATQGPYRWLEIALMVAVGFFAILGAVIFFLHWHRALVGLRALDPPESTWTLTEEAIAQKSSLGESAIGWEALIEVWRFDDLWILIWGRDVYSSIPSAQLPREARQMIERRAKVLPARKS
ncbi:MAG TPA: YcxB family protein [Usitatibacteraceae bacterium]|nr:YcxB family protein [Usitatibacteraceae bacterium]